MNKTQLLVMWVGIAFIVIIGLASPLNSSRAIVIHGDPGAERLAFITKDIALLFMRWTMTAIVTAGLIYTLRDKEKSDRVWQWITKLWQSNEQTDKKPKDEQKE